jgi:uncharacterized RDD family membrane protein YckC
MRFVSLSFLFLVLLSPCVSAEVHDVLAHASPERAWIAKVSTQNSGSGPIEQTDLLIRQSGPGERWKTLATVPARVISLASRSSQLVILQSNGDWKLIWSTDGGSSGQPLPGGGRIRAIGDDGETLWAIGAVKGGINAATEPAATEPAPQPAVVPATQPLLPYQLVLFEQQSGRWVALAEIPPETGSSESVIGDISLAIVADHPVVALQLSDGAIRVLRWKDGHAWENLDFVPPLPGEKITDFQLISTDTGAMLWTNNGKSLGRLYRAGDTKARPVDLKWVGDNAPDSPPAITAYGGYLRLIGLHAGRIYEQRYEPDGSPVGSAAELVVPTNLNDSPLKQWLNTALLVALTFSVMATMYRRTLQRRRTTALTPPPPAPLMIRAAAGFLDLLPFLVTIAIVTARQDKSLDPQERLEDVPAIIAVSISVAIYLLHTTLSEIFTDRTLGKWLFGLQVVTVEGTKPSFLQIITRNLLRVLDLLWFPLVLVVISPLRQRSADIAAGTMVVRRDDAGEPLVAKETPEAGNDPKS